MLACQGLFLVFRSRDLVTQGDVVSASRMLGRPYRLISQVETPVPPPRWPVEESLDNPQIATIALKHSYNLVPAPGRYPVHATLKSRAQAEMTDCEAARRSLLRLDTGLWIDAHVTIRDEQSIEMPAEKYARLVEQHRSTTEREGNKGDTLLLLEFVDGE